MDAFIDLPMKERRFACLKAEEEKRLQAASVEKDFWVCWTLRELFGLPGLAQQMTFKGGTSLSKAWGLIDRFSEDIDIVVGKAALGFAGEASPDQASTKTQIRKRLDELMAACREWVQSELKSALTDRIAGRLGTKEPWHLIVDPDAQDGQCLLFQYPSAFSPKETAYVNPVVKIELGARSDDWPSELRVITPYVNDLLAPESAEPFARVPALAAERTFWEKALLLHEETFRPTDKPRRMRMARHYYDVWCLIARGVAAHALADDALFERVAGHREIFFRLGWVDYATMHRGSLRLTPPDHQLDDWRRDYDAMAESMFYGERPAFDEILRVVSEFERQFNAGAGSS